MTKREADACTEESLAYDEALRRADHLVETATTVRVRNGKLSDTDGPVAETTDQLGGFILIVTRDLNEANQVAARIPLARRGSIEVRPNRELRP